MKFNKENHMHLAIAKGTSSFVLFTLICVLAKFQMISPLVVACLGIIVPFLGYYMVMDELEAHQKTPQNS